MPKMASEKLASLLKLQTTLQGKAGISAALAVDVTMPLNSPPEPHPGAHGNIISAAGEKRPPVLLQGCVCQRI